MISNKSGNCTSTSGSVHLNLALTETPYRPSFGQGCLGKGVITCSPLGQRMPVISISLNDQASLLKHEVGLEASEHSLVHLKPKTALLELTIQSLFNGSHLLRECSLKPKLPQFFLHLWGVHLFGCPFTPLLAYLWAHIDLSHLLSKFGVGPTATNRPADFLLHLTIRKLALRCMAQPLLCFWLLHDSAYFLSMFGCSRINPTRHLGSIVTQIAEGR